MLNNDHIDELISRRESELKCYQNLIKKIKDEIKRLIKSKVKDG